MVSQNDALQKKYPNAAYYTPKMIADVAGVTERTVQRDCRRMFPFWRGQHWRFAKTNGGSDWMLSSNDLEELLEYLAQLKERPIFFKK